jgi:hypothetical protein
MAAASESEPPCITQRPPVADLQPSEERTPEAGTSESDDQVATAAEARPDEPAAEAPEKKKRDTRAAEADHDAGGSSFGSVEPARRPTAGEESAGERHRTEMAGRVRIPDMWGQERLRRLRPPAGRHRRPAQRPRLARRRAPPAPGAERLLVIVPSSFRPSLCFSVYVFELIIYYWSGVRIRSRP